MNDVTPELSRIVAVARIPQSGWQETIEAKPAERAALAKRFALADLAHLTADVTLRHDGKDAFHATGTILADATQTCVVSLEPLPVHLRITIDLHLMAAIDSDAVADHDGGDDDLAQEVDTFDNGKIDIGEIVAQYLGVSLDPYPRKQGAELPKSISTTSKNDTKPLAILLKQVHPAGNPSKDE